MKILHFKAKQLCKRPCSTSILTMKLYSKDQLSGNQQAAQVYYWFIQNLRKRRLTYREMKTCRNKNKDLEVKNCKLLRMWGGLFWKLEIKGSVSNQIVFFCARMDRTTLFFSLWVKIHVPIFNKTPITFSKWWDLRQLLLKSFCHYLTLCLALTAGSQDSGESSFLCNFMIFIIS